MHLEPQTYRNAVNRIHRIKGCLHAFEKMLYSHHPYDISVQLMAIQGGVKSFNTLMHEAFLMDINLRLHTPLTYQNLSLHHVQHIELLKHKLCTYSPQQLQQILYAIRHNKFPFS